MPKRTLILDIEIFSNFFYAGFLDVETGKLASVEQSEDTTLDIPKLRRLLMGNRLVTFNGATFDLPLCSLALTGQPTDRIKNAADVIIKRNLRGWQFVQEWGIEPLQVDHIDLIEVAPGVASLKIYGGRMHCRHMQDLPYDPDHPVDAEQREQIRRYCRNDLETTAELYRILLPQIELRERMSKQYGVDLRSRSDAQIAEVVLSHQVEKLSGKRVERPIIPPGTVYRYRVPEFVRFTTSELQAKLDEIARAKFMVMDNGSIADPPELKGAAVTIGQGVYRLGIGGLHSSETCTAHVADDDHIIVDRDVASYYPAIILRLGLMPRAMGGSFLRVYKDIVARRLEAKRSGDKVTANSLKITINGSFGKFGNKWSKLYSPDMLIQTTVTGQLCLLMLIEALEQHADIQVLSANTDGIVIRCHRSAVAEMEAIVNDWERRTGFETEESQYRALYSRDVNNYIAIKTDGGVKLKGAYAAPSLAKNPNNTICVEAAVRWLIDGTPVDRTIRECQDIRKFVTIRSVKGGAVKDGRYLGKAVRWYYAEGVDGVIQYQVNGYTVPRTKGAKPLMELPDEFPDDLDHQWYVDEALSILAEVGAFNDIA